MSNFISETCKKIREDETLFRKVPKKFRATLIILTNEPKTYGEGDTDDNVVANHLRQVFEDEDVTIQRYVALAGSTIFKFKILDNEYTIATMTQAIDDNVIGSISRNRLAFAVRFMNIILPLGANTSVEGDVLDLWRDVEPKKDSYGNLEVHPLLEKLKDFVDEQNYDGCLQGVLRYPHLNQKRKIKKHLLLGFSSNGGKSLIHKMVTTLYDGICITQDARPDKNGSVFDVGGWNKDVEGTFVTIIGDNNPKDPPSDIFIKSFMEQPLRIRSQGGENRAYNYLGSSMILTNNMHIHFKNTENDKRLQLIQFDKTLSKKDATSGFFTEKEVNTLYDVLSEDVQGLVTFLTKYKDTSSFMHQNKNNWGSDIEDEVKLTMIPDDKVCSYKLLNFMYSREIVEPIIKRCGFELKKGRPYDQNGNLTREDTHPNFRNLGKVKLNVDQKEIVHVVHQHNRMMNLPQRKTKKELIRFYDERIARVDNYRDIDPRFDGDIYFVKLVKGSKAKRITSETVAMHTALVTSFSTTQKSLNMLCYEMNRIFKQWIVVQTPERVIDDISGQMQVESLVAVGFFEKPLYPKEYKTFCEEHNFDCLIEGLTLIISEAKTSETFKSE